MTDVLTWQLIAGALAIYAVRLDVLARRANRAWATLLRETVAEMAEPTPAGSRETAAQGPIQVFSRPPDVTKH